MNDDESAFSSAVDKEMTALIATLHEAGRRLEELTGGEVDAVLGPDGTPFLLQHAQEKLRLHEVARQAAILNALPAHVVMVDNQGSIVSFNRGWQKFAQSNGLSTELTGINYLDACGDGGEVAEGILSVLAGDSSSFAIEYPCHSPTQQRWFLMTVTPLTHSASTGAVIMHLDITDRVQAEVEMKSLNRVYAMLSQINALVVRVKNLDELFAVACQVAADAGDFRMSAIVMVDPKTKQMTSIVSAGKDEKLLTDIKKLLASPEGMKKSIVSTVIEKGKPAISNNVKIDTRFVFGDQYADAGVNSAVVLPLLISGEAVGVFALYAREIDFFQKDEIKLLVGLATDVAFAINNIEKQKRLNFLAYYDELTGLANRNLFLERLSAYMYKANSEGHQLAIGLIDLDRFKNINDSFGRLTGDALLKKAAEWLKDRFLDTTYLGRIEADCFAIILPLVKSEGHLESLIENTMSAFLAHAFEVNSNVFRISVKSGIALFPDDGTDAVSLLKNAEAAMKIAKKSGVNYLFHTQSMTATTADRLALELRLREAFDKDEFTLYYQPKVNIASGKMVGAEALIRWNDPHIGLIQPDTFIPILEEIGLINEVGRWVIKQAIKDYLSWREAGLNAVRIAVNVSSLQLRNRNFADDIEQAIASDPRVAAGLEIEVTESVIMGDVEQSVEILQAIRDLGIPITIDDFGTGFSSLSYLSRLPLDILKIDGAFVREMHTEKGGKMVSTIILVAHALKLKVVAECVETEEQLLQLRKLDCDQMQGYLFSKPVPADVFEKQFLSLS
ncbi:bifunctional diguanylate cyclase/phosphodiesterase [Zhongshania arctica]|uniref:EAL domain-containing protein n=1 Tax=Zhongshania arctica TaxID=3238302 RepID=A0ABV3TU40_9GAMM